MKKSIKTKHKIKEYIFMIFQADKNWRIFHQGKGEDIISILKQKFQLPGMVKELIILNHKEIKVRYIDNSETILEYKEVIDSSSILS